MKYNNKHLAFIYIHKSIYIWSGQNVKFFLWDDEELFHIYGHLTLWDIPVPYSWVRGVDVASVDGGLQKAPEGSGRWRKMVPLCLEH